MSGGAWGYLEYKFKSGDAPAWWLPLIFDALGEVEHLMDWAVCCDTSKDDAMPKVWDRLHLLFEELSGGITLPSGMGWPRRECPPHYFPDDSEPCPWCGADNPNAAPLRPESDDA